MNVIQFSSQQGQDHGTLNIGKGLLKCGTEVALTEIFPSIMEIIYIF